MHREEFLPRVKRIPGPKAKAWANFHLKYAAPTTYETNFIWDRTKPAIGPFCTDVDNNIIIDFVSHVASNPLGYNNPEILSLLYSIKQVDPDRYAGCDFISAFGDSPEKSALPTPSHLHHKVAEITKHLGLSHAFFCNSGAEAVENAIKVCYNLRHNHGYGLCFDGAFHGRTLGALSLNRSKTVHRKWFPHVPNVFELPYCACKSECMCGWKIVSKTGRHTNILADRFNTTFNPEEVSYIIFEPIQGEGGYRIANNEFVSELFDIAHEHDIPVISDEIQAGMGRTGKWWSIEHYKQKPDVLTSAKALRVGACISKKEFFPKEAGRLSSTWGEGNFIHSAVAYKTIELIQEDNLLDNARLKGKYFVHRLQELENKFKFISNVRGVGLMDAVTVDTAKRRDKIKHHALKHGLLIAGCGYRSIRLLPPLDVTKREIDICVDILTKACHDSR